MRVGFWLLLLAACLACLSSVAEGKTYTKPRGVDPAVADEFSSAPARRAQQQQQVPAAVQQPVASANSYDAEGAERPGNAHIAFCAS